MGSIHEESVQYPGISLVKRKANDSHYGSNNRKKLNMVKMSDSAATMIPAAPTFLGVPREIRDKIYANLHCEHTGGFNYVFGYKSPAPGRFPIAPVEIEDAPLINVLLTNKQVSAEYKDSNVFRHLSIKLNFTCENQLLPLPSVPTNMRQVMFQACRYLRHLMITMSTRFLNVTNGAMIILQQEFNVHDISTIRVAYTTESHGAITKTDDLAIPDAMTVDHALQDMWNSGPLPLHIRWIPPIQLAGKPQVQILQGHDIVAYESSGDPTAIWY